MRSSAVLSLSSVLVKSYLRASRSTNSANIRFTRPWILILIDAIVLLIPFAVLQFAILPNLSGKNAASFGDVASQVITGLPIGLTSAVILSGILLELGRGSIFSSSESVNWLPLTPREYVTASALSMTAVYSPFLMAGISISLPLAMKFGLMPVWPLAALLSVLALLLGAFTVEALRAVTNRLSTSVYRRSGKFSFASRLILITAVLVVTQLSFNSYFLYRALGVIVRGVELVWFVPMVWPSVSTLDLLAHQDLQAGIFAGLAAAFTAGIFVVAVNLRTRFWSSVPVVIAVTEGQRGYSPRKSITLSLLGFGPVDAAIALKEFRALLRRKELARFMSMPVILVVSFFLPTFLTPASDNPGRAPGLILAGFVPFMVPLLFSMMSIGQEGRSVINLCMLPISAKQVIKGKLLPSWVIAFAATIAMITVFSIVSPAGSYGTYLTIFSSIFVIAAESFIGLGIAARHPDYYASGQRGMYVTLTGFLTGFMLGGAAAVTIFAPTIVRLSFGLASFGHISPAAAFQSYLATTAIGASVCLVAYLYCKKGVVAWLSNVQA